MRVLVGRKNVMFEVSVAQAWSGLFFFNAPSRVDGSLRGKGTHSSQKAMIC
jgi:hypothetical protein